MKNKIALVVLSAALIAPTGLLWADDAGTMAPATPAASTTTPPKAAKKHHKHHKKTTTPAASTSNTAPAPAATGN